MFHTVIHPRVSETDGTGHINSTSIPIWLEAGRDEIFRMFTPDLSFLQWRMVIVNTNIDYVAQLFYGKEVRLSTWVKRIGNSSLVLYEELHQEGKLCTKALVTYVNFNFATQKSEPISAEVRAQLSQHFMPSAAPTDA